MGVFYRARVKVSLHGYKLKYIDGLYVTRDIVADVAQAKAHIVDRTLQTLGPLRDKAIVEVVLFRRSDIGFILSGPPKDLEDSK